MKRNKRSPSFCPLVSPSNWKMFLKTLDTTSRSFKKVEEWSVGVGWAPEPAHLESQKFFSFAVLIVGVPPPPPSAFLFQVWNTRGSAVHKGAGKGKGGERGWRSNSGGSACLLAEVSPRAEYLRWSQGEVRWAQIMLALFLLLSRPPALSTPSSTIPTGGA